jgi:cell division protein FtsB
MVTHRRLRAVLNALALYAISAGLIAYFGVNAYSGNYGLRAKQEIEGEIRDLDAELVALRVEREKWERRISLLRSESLDPDMLEERARVLLNFGDPRDLVLPLKRP